jgi:chromosome segregation ATPase
MPNTVEVQMQLDDSGVVQRIEAQGQAYEQVAQSANEASEATERQSEAAQDGASAAERGAQAQREQANAAEANEQAQREAAQSARQYAAASDRMAGASSNASQVIFSTGDAIQDAQFGLRGAANNIAFVAESFAELQRQSGGTRTAFQGLFAALKGPAGLILGLQALLALGPQIVDFFDSFIGGAEDAEKASERLNDALDEVFDFQDADLQEIDTAIGKTRRRLRQLREEVELGPGALTADEIFPSDPAGQIQTAIETLDELDSQDVSILPGSENIQEVVRSVEAVENPAENARRALVAVLRDFRERSPQALDEIDNLEAGLEKLRKRRKEVATEVEARNALSRAGVTLLEEEEQAAEESAEGFELATQAVEATNEAIRQQPELKSPLPTDLTEGEQAIADVREEIEMVNAMPFLNQAAKGERRVQAVVRGIREAQAAGREFSENEIQMIINALGLAGDEAEAVRRKLEGTAETATGVFENMEEVVGGALASGFRELGAAIGEGQKAMQAFGKAAASILSQIGQAIGKQLIAQGTAMIAAGNPTGAAYIASGGTIIAASAALSSIAGGSGGGGGESASASSGTSEEGGGEVGAEVDAPGRRRGGPVEGGRLYRTHGLGQREFFRPSMDGQIVTAGGMRAAAGGGQGGAMTVNVEANGEISAEDFDIASLRAELNELSADVSDLT